MSRRELPPIHVTVPGSSDDPRRDTPAPEGVVVHYSPPLHPDDVETFPNGLRVTSLARTLVDLAEVLTRDELCETFDTARRRGRLDLDAVRASRARVEWRPSLAMLDAVIADFASQGAS